MLSKGSTYDYTSGFQDWAPVIIAGKEQQSEMVMEVDEPKKRECKLTSQMARAITEARVNKQLSRKEVAKQCDIPLEALKDYEMGNGMIEEKHINKLSKFLCVQLKKN